MIALLEFFSLKEKKNEEIKCENQQKRGKKNENGSLELQHQHAPLYNVALT